MICNRFLSNNTSYVLLIKYRRVCYKISESVALLSDTFLSKSHFNLVYLCVFTTRDVRNTGSSDGSKISELMENNASWVDNRSKVIHSSTA